MTAARSRHPDGVLAANADGSVRFVDETIASDVWTAIGSMDGGEGGAALWAAIFPSADRTYPVRGTVEFEQQPIATGEIFFDPPPAAGQARSAVITDGVFSISAEEGLLRGLTYVVRVHGYRTTGTKYENADMNLSAEILDQYLPPHYSGESQLRFETSAANLRDGLTLELD